MKQPVNMDKVFYGMQTKEIRKMRKWTEKNEQASRNRELKRMRFHTKGITSLNDTRMLEGKRLDAKLGRALANLKK